MMKKRCCFVSIGKALRLKGNWFLIYSRWPYATLNIDCFFSLSLPPPPHCSCICSLVSLWAPSLKKKVNKKRNRASWHIRLRLDLSPRCACLDENVIYSPHFNHGDPIYWLAYWGGGKGVITAKYYIGTAVALLIGSVKVTWFQLNWRLDFDSIFLPGVFFFFLSKVALFLSLWLEWCVDPLMPTCLRNVGVYWGLQSKLFC